MAKLDSTRPGQTSIRINNVEYIVYVFDDGAGNYRGEAIHPNGRAIVSTSSTPKVEDAWAAVFGSLHVWASDRGRP